MEIAIAGNNTGCTPFQREVREWQHIDPNTGVLLTGRLQSDRWTNGSKTNYGKMVDSQNLSQSNGTHHTQHKQFEVLQAHTSAGPMQLIRAETVQTTSSRWSSSQSASATLTKNGVNKLINNKHDKSDSIDILNTAPSLKLSNLMKNGSNVLNPSHALSVIERHQQFTNNAVRLLDGKRSVSVTTTTTTSTNTKPFLSSSTISGLQHQYQSNQPTTSDYNINVGGSGGGTIDLSTTINGDKNCNSNFIESFRNTKTQDNNTSTKSLNLQRGRSVSTDDLTTNWNHHQSDGDNDEPTEWRRVSTIRRSFQFPENSSNTTRTTRSRPLDLPESSVSVSKIRDELENGRRLSTVMRNNNVNLAALDDILNSTEIKTKKKSASFLTAESLKEIRGKLKKLSDESLYKDDFIIKDDHDKKDINVNVNLPLKDNSLADMTQEGDGNNNDLKSHQHTTNSLEARLKNKDISSSEWHQRRKSYGFEKMIPQHSNAMAKLESSTDSGIGRSTEIGNWSPTESKNRTVITFGGRAPLEKPSFLRPMAQRRTFEKSINNNYELKRHSIAVDETKYVRDNLRKTSIHLNGIYPQDSTVNESYQNMLTASTSEEQARRQKRVEFCKTEVHFAAESGRVNIVETDEKPPPTQNFRRRRRNLVTNDSYPNAFDSGLAVIHFGDEKKTLPEKAFLTSEEYVSAIETRKNNVTVSIPITTDIRNTNIKKSLIDDMEEQSIFQDESSIRGILKNKPIKPKPYHLGENIDSTDDLWGVKLKSINKDDDVIPVRNTKLIGEKDETFEEFKAATTHRSVVSSVAERMKIVPKQKDGIGYSTKINLSHSNSPTGWNQSDAPVSHNHHYQSLNQLKAFNKSENNTQSVVIPKKHLNDSLKSTQLIINSMRSPSEHLPSKNSIVLSITSNTNNIIKSNSATSIQEPVFIPHPKYSSSLDGDSKFCKNIKSNGSLYEKSAISNQIIKHQTNLGETSYNKPIAAPRIKILGSSNAISHQLSQLRRLYDKASESDDSTKADEEVKKYFDNEEEYAQSSSSVINKSKIKTNTFVEDTASELSGSWSRIKRERNVNKFQTNENMLFQESPNSNVMSIALHSLESTNEKIPNSDIQNGPIAKPRTLNSAVLTKESHAANEKSSLKIQKDINGARKLREHELSYFGVKIDKPDMKNATNNKTNSHYRRETINLQIIDRASNGSLLNSNKPDLLQHSINNCVEIQPKYSKPENSAAIVYNRKTDLNRDEMILKEMNSNAKQTLKDINDDINRKEQKRRSIEKQSLATKPLETIKENLSKKPTRTDLSSRTVTDLNQLQQRRSCCQASQMKRTKSVSSNDSQPRSRSGSIEKPDQIKTRSAPNTKISSRIKTNEVSKGQKSKTRIPAKELTEKNRSRVEKNQQRSAKSNETHKLTSQSDHKSSYHHYNELCSLSDRISPEYQNKHEINHDNRKISSVSSNKVKNEHHQYLTSRKSQKNHQTHSSANCSESVRNHHHSSNGHKNGETLISAKKSTTRSKSRSSSRNH